MAAEGKRISTGRPGGRAKIITDAPGLRMRFRTILKVGSARTPIATAWIETPQAHGCALIANISAGLRGRSARGFCHKTFSEGRRLRRDDRACAGVNLRKPLRTSSRARSSAGLWVGYIP